MTRTIGVGIIGMGFRGSNLAQRLIETAAETGMRITAISENRPDRLAEIGSDLARTHRDHGQEVAFQSYLDWRELVQDPAVDLVMVTTPSFAHKEPALATLEAGKRLYLDKPIAHNMPDSRVILEAESQHGAPMILGFTRRYEAPWRRAYELVQAGAIGRLQMIQIRSVIPYHRYFQRWHRRRAWSGGALNDKSAHHMDVFNWFVGSRATTLSALGGRNVLVPDPTAPERCLDCHRECPYRAAPHRDDLAADHPLILERGRAWIDADEKNRFDNCVYGPEADINDHAVVQIGYENGVKASLFLSFFGPESKDQETLELVGDRGRIILVRHTGMLDLVSDFGREQRMIDCRTEEFGSSHFGADLALVRELSGFSRGAPPVVSAQSGYDATLMVMAAHESIDGGGNQVEIDRFDRKS